MLRQALIGAGLLLAAASALGCASSDTKRVEDAARAECRVLQPNVMPEDPACVRQIEENIRQARQYQPPPPPRPSKQKARR